MRTTTNNTTRRRDRATPASSKAPSEITPALIRIRTHDIFQARNGGSGGAVCDWERAQRELADALIGAEAD